MILYGEGGRVRRLCVLNSVRTPSFFIFCLIKILTDSESEEEMQMEVSRTTDQIPIITNIFQYMECPWEDNIDIVED